MGGVLLCASLRENAGHIGLALKIHQPIAKQDNDS